MLHSCLSEIVLYSTLLLERFYRRTESSFDSHEKPDYACQTSWLWPLLRGATPGGPRTSHVSKRVHATAPRHVGFRCQSQPFSPAAIQPNWCMPPSLDEQPSISDGATVAELRNLSLFRHVWAVPRHPGESSSADIDKGSFKKIVIGDLLALTPTSS